MPITRSWQRDLEQAAYERGEHAPMPTIADRINYQTRVNEQLAGEPPLDGYERIAIGLAFGNGITPAEFARIVRVERAKVRARETGVVS